MQANSTHCLQRDRVVECTGLERTAKQLASAGLPAQQVKGDSPAGAETGSKEVPTIIGGVAERLNAPVLKTGSGASHS
jgi:hypothetical protein